MSEQEWVSVKHTPAGTSATVTVKHGNTVVRWTSKAYVGTVRQSVAEARLQAKKAMAELEGSA